MAHAQEDIAVEAQVSQAQEDLRVEVQAAQAIGISDDMIVGVSVGSVCGDGA